MDCTFKHCVKMLTENTVSAFQSAIQIICEVCYNIIKFPKVEKYMKLSVADPTIHYWLLPVSGAIELLFELGFIKDDEFLLLPKNFSLEKIEKAYTLLNDVNKLVSSELNCLPSQSSSQDSQPTKFFTTIIDTYRNVLSYENTELHELVRIILPITKLRLNAIKNLRELQKEIKLKSENNRKNCLTEYDLSFDYLLITEIMSWFKNEFYTWMNSPKCRFCSRTCKFRRTEFTNDPKVSRVEFHRCDQCGTEEKFLRYTDLKTLLKTRTGRCGEWASVFTLICRTLGYDARIIYDQTDHVWTEVWLISLNRWIHVDPCENILDSPLLYEKGWRKKISYIIAFSKDEIQDVTWRYTRNQTAVLKRRIICSEQHLLDFILCLNKVRLELMSKFGLSKTRKNFIIKRRLFELVELIPALPGTFKPHERNNDEYGGRISGDAAWKIARNETSDLNHYVWKVPQGINTFRLQYFIVEDIYHVLNSKNGVLKMKRGWKAGINSCSGNIFRKVENDWQMVYLARSPENEIGTVTWSIKINDEEINVDFFEFSADTTIFDNGSIKWIIQCFNRDNTITTLFIPNSTYFEIYQPKKICKINLTAELSGDSKNISWQHSQLFRKSSKSMNECSMNICLSLSNEQ